VNAPCQWFVTLIDAWQLRCDGQPVLVAFRQQRVIAALALHKAVHRANLAGMLWPESSDTKAAGNLRESLWVISHRLPELLVDNADPLELRDEVRVDVREVRKQISRLEDASSPALESEILDRVRGPGLLPGWYEDWVVSEQERWERLRLDVLERLARAYLQRGDINRALESAFAAVAIDPLRESAQRLKVQTYLADGNFAAALQAYREFRSRLLDEVGVAPSDKITEIMQPLLRSAADSEKRSADRRVTKPGTGRNPLHSRRDPLH
jgi:DNA-binding SARP family transcriptional activator